jgi:hypothetical protein
MTEKPTRIGALIRGAFGMPASDRDAIRQVKDWARASLGGRSDTAFAVNEIACTDPSCPGIETVILIMEPGAKTRACKIAKGLAEVSEQDVVAALST